MQTRKKKENHGKQKITAAATRKALESGFHAQHRGARGSQGAEGPQSLRALNAARSSRIGRRQPRSRPVLPPRGERRFSPTEPTGREAASTAFRVPRLFLSHTAVTDSISRNRYLLLIRSQKGKLTHAYISTLTFKMKAENQISENRT